MTESAACASAPLTRAWLRLRRLPANPDPAKPNNNPGAAKTLLEEEEEEEEEKEDSMKVHPLESLLLCFLASPMILFGHGGAWVP